MAGEERITLSEAARRSGVSPNTLKRWAADKVIPVRRGRWTAAAAAQARVVARMRERGHSLDELRKAGREGRLSFGLAEDLFPRPQGEEQVTVEDVAEETGLEPELIERILVILGTPIERERVLDPGDVDALRHCARVLGAGFPLVAFLQLVRVYVQSLRRIADAEVRLTHLYVHEPMIRDGVPELEMAENLGDLAADVLPLAAPLTEYLHTRYLRFYLEQDVVGHMERELGADTAQIAQVPVALCFIDLTGFTRYTEEEGDLEALDVVENFVATVETTLPPEATVVKTIGDEVMVVSRDPGPLTEWAVDLLARLPERPRPRVGIHYGDAVYRDGDYFGSHVNLAHRVVNRAHAGELLVTDRVIEAVESREGLEFEPIGEVNLKGFPEPTALYVISAAP